VSSANEPVSGSKYAVRTEPSVTPSAVVLRMETFASSRIATERIGV
jgi:hypothetical protein